MVYPLVTFFKTIVPIGILKGDIPFFLDFEYHYRNFHLIFYMCQSIRIIVVLNPSFFQTFFSEGLDKDLLCHLTWLC